jgi:hypothetical protein
MTTGRALLFAIAALGAGGAAGSAPKGPPRETWVTPERRPKDCGWYRTADPEHWSDAQKAAAERECRVLEEWQAFVTARQACSADKDCALVESDCPFGCMNVPVAAAHAKVIAEKQRELQKKMDVVCKYKCQPVTRTVCEKGWCVGAW